MSESFLEFFNGLLVLGHQLVLDFFMFVQLVLEAAVLLFQQVVLFGFLVQVLLDVADWIHQFLDLLLVFVFRKLPS